jgi:hypothetical protein
MYVASSELGPPHPLPQASVSPPLDPKGVSNTRLRVREWGDPVKTTGQKAWHWVFSVPRNGILGHQFNKRLKYFVACNSQSLLLADFT